jgi:superfamily II DNA helicase RecQ
VGIAVNDKIGFVLCRCCNEKVNGNDLKKHFRSKDHHNAAQLCQLPEESYAFGVASTDDYARRLLEEYPLLKAASADREEYFPTSKDPTGICCLPIVYGWACLKDECLKENFGAIQESVFKSGTHSKHKKVRAFLQIQKFRMTDNRSLTVLAETIEYVSPLLPAFAWNDDSNLLNRFDKVLRDFAKLPVTMPTSSARASTADEKLRKNLKPFFTKALFTEFMATHRDWKLVIECIKAPTDCDSSESKLQRALQMTLKTFLIQYSQEIPKQNRYIRINIKGRTSGDIKRDEMFFPISNSSAKDYAELIYPMMRLVLALLDISDAKIGSSYPEMRSILSNIEGFHAAVSTLKLALDAIASTLPLTPSEACLTALFTVSKLLCLQVYDELAKHSNCFFFQYMAIHSMSIKTPSKEESDDEGVGDAEDNRFVVFGRAKEVERTCAALMYFIRLTAMLQYINHFRLGSTTSDREMVLKSVQELCNSPASTVHSIMNLANANPDKGYNPSVSYGVGSGGLPRYDELHLRSGKVVSLEMLSKALRGLLEKLKVQQKKLYRNLSFPDDLRPLISEYTDEDSRDHRFGDGAANKSLHRLATTYWINIMKLITTGAGVDSIRSIDDIKNLALDAELTKEFLKDVCEYHRLLFTLIHILQSTPGRASEQETVTTGNILVDGVIVKRSTFWHPHYQAILMLYVYNKSEAHDDVVRFITGDLANCFIFDQVILRFTLATVGFLRQAISADKCDHFGEFRLKTRYLSFLFIDCYSGEELNGDTFRNLVTKTLFETLNLRLEFSELRQILATFINQVVKAESNSSSKENQLVQLAAKGMGHSILTHFDEYDVNAANRGLDPRRIAYVFAFTMLCQRLLLGESSREIEERPGNVIGETIVSAATPKYSPSSDELREDRRPKASTSPITGLGDYHTSEYGRFSLDKTVHRRTVDEQIMAVELLTHCYGPSATFKCPAQAELILQVLASLKLTKDKVFVLPTASGKSGAIFVVVEREIRLARTENRLTRVTIVVVPLNALAEDLCNHSKKIGHNAVRYTGHESLNDEVECDVLYVTPEGVVANAVMRYIIKLAAADRLALIVIDEFHDMFSSMTYRNCLDAVRFLGQFGKASMVFLTATLPQEAYEVLKRFLGFESLEIERFPSEPTNISFMVKKLPNSMNIIEGALELCMMIAENYDTSLEYNRVVLFEPTIAGANALYDKLKKHGLHAGIYHAKLETKVKEEMLSKWNTFCGTEIHFMVATSAFGLGISNEKCFGVIFAGMPYTSLDFVQQSGRAGRAIGSHSFSILLWNENHLLKRKMFNNEKMKTLEVASELARSGAIPVFKALQDAMEKVCVENTV